MMIILFLRNKGCQPFYTDFDKSLLYDVWVHREEGHSPSTALHGIIDHGQVPISTARASEVWKWLSNKKSERAHPKGCSGSLFCRNCTLPMNSLQKRIYRNYRRKSTGMLPTCAYAKDVKKSRNWAEKMHSCFNEWEIMRQTACVNKTWAFFGF